MPKFAVGVFVAVLAFVAVTMPARAAPPVWVNPAITGAGAMHPLPHAAYQPDPHATYKVVFSLTAAGAKPGEVSPSLEGVARAVNLYVNAGVPLDHLKFVVVIYHAATPIALDAAHYRGRFGVANPNLPVIAQLRHDGIDVVVCGQAWEGSKYDYAWVDHDVKVALSGLTTITELEQQGYALMPL